MKVEIKGLQTLYRRLNRKLLKIENETYRPALLKFAEPIRAAAERLAQAQISPRLKFNTVISRWRGGFRVRIGPSGAEFRKTADGKTVTHGMIVFWFEHGYDLRRTPRGRVIGHVGARRTLTPAYLANKETALAAMIAELKQALEVSTDNAA